MFFGRDFPVSKRCTKDSDKLASDYKKHMRRASFELKIRPTFSGPVISQFFGTLMKIEGEVCDDSAYARELTLLLECIFFIICFYRCIKIPKFSQSKCIFSQADESQAKKK